MHLTTWLCHEKPINVFLLPELLILTSQLLFLLLGVNSAHRALQSTESYWRELEGPLYESQGPLLQ